MSKESICKEHCTIIKWWKERDKRTTEIIDQTNKLLSDSELLRKITHEEWQEAEEDLKVAEQRIKELEKEIQEK